MENQLTRRTLLKKGAAISLGLPVLGLSSAFQNILAKTNYVDEIGIQLYTVRNQLAENPKKTLQSIAQLGYKQVELMDIASASELMAFTKDLGLMVRSSFFMWTHITGRWDLAEKYGLPKQPEGYDFNRILDDAKSLGLKHLVFGYMLPDERSTMDDYKKITEKLNRSGELCKKRGIQLCYHNHSFEFGPIEGEIPYEYLMENFDEDLVKFELDVFWASLGGYDPVQLMDKLDGRISQLHLKDKLKGAAVIFAEQEVPPETFKELGNGVVDIKTIVRKAEKIGVQECHVEQDQSPDPINSIGQSISYLKRI